MTVILKRCSHNRSNMLLSVRIDTSQHTDCCHLVCSSLVTANMTQLTFSTCQLCLNIIHICCISVRQEIPCLYESRSSITAIGRCPQRIEYSSHFNPPSIGSVWIFSRQRTRYRSLKQCPIWSGLILCLRWVKEACPVIPHQSVIHGFTVEIIR